MLREVPNVRQHPGDCFRRFFTDEALDMYVWYIEGLMVGFQLCYDKHKREQAVSYLEGRGYWLSKVLTGEDSVWDGSTPVLIPSQDFPGQRVLDEFMARGQRLEHAVFDYVMKKLTEQACRLGMLGDTGCQSTGP